ncbi:MAG: hypothetical protein AB1397_07760 [bacterium]
MTKELKYIKFVFDEAEKELKITAGNNEVIIKKPYLGSLQRFLIRIAEKMSHKKGNRKKYGIES